MEIEIPVIPMIPQRLLLFSPFSLPSLLFFIFFLFLFLFLFLEKGIPIGRIPTCFNTAFYSKLFELNHVPVFLFSYTRLFTVLFWVYEVSRLMDSHVFVFWKC